jgi:hypothetical protein
LFSQPLILYKKNKKKLGKLIYITNHHRIPNLILHSPQTISLALPAQKSPLLPSLPSILQNQNPTDFSLIIITLPLLNQSINHLSFIFHFQSLCLIINPVTPFPLLPPLPQILNPNPKKKSSNKPPPFPPHIIPPPPSHSPLSLLCKPP